MTPNPVFNITVYLEVEHLRNKCWPKPKVWPPIRPGFCYLQIYKPVPGPCKALLHTVNNPAEFHFNMTILYRVIIIIIMLFFQIKSHMSIEHLVTILMCSVTH